MYIKFNLINMIYFIRIFNSMVGFVDFVFYIKLLRYTGVKVNLISSVN